MSTMAVSISANVKNITFSRLQIGSTNSQSNNTELEKTVSANKIINLPDGGTEYDYYINNQLGYTRVPPDGFDLSTATDEQLNYYGIPHHNDEIAGLSKSDSQLKKFKVNAIKDKLVIKHNSTISKHGPTLDLLPKLSSTTVQTGDNWSGSLLSCGAYSITEVEGKFKQAEVQSNDVPDSYESSWVGMGAYNNKLIQCGTAMEHTHYGYYGCRYYAFHEYLNQNYDTGMVEYPDLAISPGDTIYCEIIYNADQSVTFFVSNYTTGHNGSYTQTNMNAYYDGTTGEWMDERPAYITLGGLNFHRLTNFSMIKWYNCNVFRRNSSTPRTALGFDSGLDYSSYFMKRHNTTNVYLSYSVKNDSHSFTDTWLCAE